MCIAAAESPASGRCGPGCKRDRAKPLAWVPGAARIMQEAGPVGLHLDPGGVPAGPGQGRAKGQGKQSLGRRHGLRVR